MLDLLRWLLAIFFGFVGIMTIGTNYACFWVAYRERRGVSMMPIIGGLSLGLGLLACPLPGTAQYAWLPPLADPGCVPVVMLVGLTALVRKIKG